MFTGSPKSRGTSGIVVVLVVLILVLGASLAYVVVTPRQSGSGSGVVTVTSTVSSGGGGPVTSTRVGTVTSVSDLVAQAKAEGASITVYTIQDPTTYNTYFLPNIMKTYPWLKVTPVFLDPAATISRPTSELKAGKVTADIVETGSISRVVTDVANGVCSTVDLSSYLAGLGYPAYTYNTTGGKFYIRWTTPYVLFYNTNLVSPSQVPRAYTDWALPQWKGKIAIDNPVGGSAAATALAALYVTLGNQSWTQFMKAFSANQPGLEPSGGTVETLVTQGQYAIGIDTLNGVLNSIKMGLPVKIAWTNPVFTAPSTFCIAQGAPHPETALLYTEWELSTFGQLALTPGNASPSSNPVFAPYALPGILPSNVTLSGVAVQTDLYSNATRWANIFTSFLSGA